MSIQAQSFQVLLTSPGYLAVAIAISLAAYIAGKIIYNIYFHPLAKFPGHWLYRGTVLPQTYHWLVGNEHEAFKALHEEYGDTVRVAPSSLSFTGAQAWKDIYGYRPGARQLPKDLMFYSRTAGKGVGDIIVSNDADHSRFRRALSHAFSDKALRDSEPILNTYFDLLISKLKDCASNPDTSTVDLVKWYNWTTFDILGDLAFGEPFQALHNAENHPFIGSFFKAFRIALLFRALRIWNLEYTVYDTLNFFSKFNRSLRYFLMNMRRDYSKDIISRRLGPERKMSERQDFMYHVLRAEGERAMSRAELEKNAGVLVIAGSETTATFLSGTTYQLVKNPDILKALTDEIRGAFKSAEDIAIASTLPSGLPYLNAVIEEGLRVYPPVPSRFPRRTAEGTLIDGQFVPADISVGVHQYSSSHSPLTYHQPDKFFPHRWLPNPPTEYANDILDSNQPFSLGPRGCLGRNLAYAEMRCILARMVWEFDLMLDERSDGWMKQKVFTLWEKGPLWVQLKGRKERV